MPGEVADIALMTDRLELPDCSAKVAVSPLGPVVARAVASGNCDLGIMIDGAGIGSCMVANKVPGVRAAMCYDEASARNSREHNGANVLTLGGKMIATDRMREIVRAWLSTELTEDRHRRRVDKINEIEREYAGEK